MILGNKKDLAINGERQVDYIRASNFAQENDCLLYEVSALTGENVENAFYKLV
jgi:Ras-related protein Rab-4B